MDMISKSKLIHGTIAATMALSMTILPIAPASAEETVSAPESDYTGWVTQDGEYYWFDSGIMARSKEIYDPGSDAWYWLDADGTMAHDKDVYPEPVQPRLRGRQEQWHTTKTCISLPEINGSGMTGMAIWSKAKITDTAVGITSTKQPAQCPKA